MLQQISIIKNKDVLEARRYDAEYFKLECLEAQKRMAELFEVGQRSKNLFFEVFKFYIM